MQSFYDFDAWADAVRGANLRLACDSVEIGTWTLGSVDLGSVVLQVATEGGGNLCYGANTHTGPILFVPLTRVNEQVVNGESLDKDSLFAIPRGADFRISVRQRAHAWCSIAFSAEIMGAAIPSSASTRIACRPSSVPRLTRIVSEIAGALISRPAGSGAHHAAGRKIIDAASACLSVATPSWPVCGRPRLDRAEIVRRAMALIDASATVPTAKELAQHAGVTDRTLLRTFQETYGVPPKKYLMLRELHVMRRALQAEVNRDTTVADVLTRHGIWEFGRFAARYQKQFGERPSETLRHAQA
jgi:AraC-like DNA-binding protein